MDSIMQILGGQMKVVFSIGLILLLRSGCSNEYQEVHLTIEDFRFTPTRVQVIPGQPIRLVVRNQGREIHRFQSRLLSASEVKINGEPNLLTINAKEGIAVPPGKSVELIMTLPSGVYEFQCPIRGHRGMKGVVIVETAGSKSSFEQSRFATCLACRKLRGGIPIRRS
ncbi:cupredoxin domain-containing protein [Candidatus Nitronereus thalassa]|uniref:Cupredoxin domain-containing protein n=1 Tax=Candidatus Nitronereus thalassa TaxID=3020898 RepID=A0ABU3KBK9_9BACT|nr:cupredoxin domain-containing protein [Candidatus Nitronereus thalassa]MDT7043800.1 cupredoxin domain-containing protein [Candidatus Nitronereus thalassa]